MSIPLLLIRLGSAPAPVILGVGKATVDDTEVSTAIIINGHVSTATIDDEEVSTATILDDP
jgi:hypothetical protein